MKARDEFQKLFGREPRLFAAPGRVNLIGEHTDYNDGFVLPMAIDRQTVVAAAARDDRRIRIRSLALGEAEIDLEAKASSAPGSWARYVEGVARSLPNVRGADLVIDTDVPAGAGLSSSAALEISVGRALLAVSGLSMRGEDLALAGQRAEHEWVGTRCGIMDQLIVALGQADHALLIDCRSLATELVPIEGAAVLVCDSRVKHDLASSAYNERRATCERAVALLQKALPDIKALRDVSLEDFAQHEKLLGDLERRRARHVVHENDRTLRAARVLRAGDLRTMGQLMYESHRSLRDDYEVSAPELDCLVDAAATTDGVYGARMTGGGFGGCTVNLVDPAKVESISAALEAAMAKRFGRAPQTFVTRAHAGVREI